MKTLTRQSFTASIWIALLWTPFALAQVGSEPTITRLTQAQILLSDQETAPPDSAAWQDQSLPDAWNRSRPSVGGFAWYRLVLKLRADQIRPSAIYLPRVNMAGLAMINSELIGGVKSFEEPLVRQWYRPQIYRIPASLLRVGENKIHLRIKAYPNHQSGLSELYFGPSEPIEQMWAQRFFWQVTSVQITSAITLGLSVMALLAWSLRRSDTAFGYFGAAAFVWVLRNIHFLWTEVPIPEDIYRIVTTSLQIWVLLLVFMFVLRFANLYLSWLERTIKFVAVGTPVLIWAVGEHRFGFASALCYAALLLIGAYILKVTIDVARRQKTVGTVLLVVASLLVYALGAHDWMTRIDLNGFSAPLNLHFGAPILFTVVTWNMFKRFSDAQVQVTELAQSLETRVREKTRELAESYESLRIIKEKQVTAQERARIMQDMHDGLGSQLVSSLAMARQGELSPDQTYDLLRSCIDDLRLAIDSATESGDSLALALGNLRFRMEPRLKAAGISVQWNTRSIDESLSLGTEQVLPLLRMIQECITNTLKHANATQLNVGIQRLEKKLLVEIQDNGHGFNLDDARQKASGMGLNSLEKRARLLTAKIHIASTNQGTRVQIQVPLQ